MDSPSGVWTRIKYSVSIRTYGIDTHIYTTDCFGGLIDSRICRQQLRGVASVTTRQRQALEWIGLPGGGTTRIWSMPSGKPPSISDNSHHGSSGVRLPNSRPIFWASSRCFWEPVSSMLTLIWYSLRVRASTLASVCGLSSLISRLNQPTISASSILIGKRLSSPDMRQSKVYSISGKTGVCT